MAHGGECLTPGHGRKTLRVEVKYQKQQSEFTGHRDHSSSLVSESTFLSHSIRVDFTWGEDAGTAVPSMDPLLR